MTAKQFCAFMGLGVRNTIVAEKLFGNTGKVSMFEWDVEFISKRMYDKTPDKLKEIISTINDSEQSVEEEVEESKKNSKNKNAKN